MPIASVTTANIGTPSTNAANIRRTTAVIHTNARAPITGNSPYARLESAAACSSRRGSVIHDPSKQILRAFDAQDDSLARSVKGERGETSCSSSFLFNGALRLVILSERAERARAKDLLVGSRGHRL